MSNKFLRRYGCDSEQELYEKVMNKDESVNELLDYLNFAKSSIRIYEKSINDPGTLLNYMENKTNLPSKDTATVLFVNTKNEAIHQKKFRVSRKAEVLGAIKEGIDAGVARVFLFFSAETKQANIDKAESYFRMLDIEVPDVVLHIPSRDSLLSKMSNEQKFLSEDSPIKETKSTFKYNAKEELGNSEDYTKFTSFMAEKNLKNKDIVVDLNTVKSNLKLGYQHHQQEVFGIIVYDKDDKILAVDELFKGTRDSSLVDSKVIIKNVLAHDDAKGIAVFHNHPSGNPEPSDADLKVTEKVRRIINVFDIELMDHFVVGKEKTLSFAQEIPGFKSDNLKYRDNIMAYKLLTREEKENYEGVNDRQEQRLMGADKEYRSVERKVRNLVENNYEDFIKAFISIEKGITNHEALDNIYKEYMESDSMSLLSDSFDEIIDNLKEQGMSLETENKALDVRVGNLVKDVEIKEVEGKNGVFKVANFSIAHTNEKGESEFTNVQVTGNKVKYYENLKKGDFVNLTGEEKTVQNKEGQDFTVFKSKYVKLLKTMEHEKETAQDKPRLNDAVIDEVKLMQDVKQSIVDFMESEYDYKENIANFDKNYPDLKHVNLAYTTTEDNKHDINFEINLVDYTWTQYLDDLVVDTGSFVDEKSGKHPLESIKEFMECADFNEMTYLDEEKVEVVGFRLDDEGYLVHPMEQVENRESEKMTEEKDFLSSEKVNGKEKNEKKEKESTLGKLEKLKKEVEKKSKKDKVDKSVER